MAYIEAAELKDALNVELDDPREDVLLDIAIAAAEEAIDDFCHRTFLVGGPVSTRTFDAVPHSSLLFVDDIASETGLSIEQGGLTVADCSQWPRNAIGKGKPIMGFHRGGRAAWSSAAPVSVTAQWGWPTVPAGVKQAMVILAVRLFKRKESPEGVAGWNDMGSVRISKYDPDVYSLLLPYTLPAVR